MKPLALFQTCVLILLTSPILPAIAHAGPTELFVFESPRTDPMKHVVSAEEKDLFYQDVEENPFEQCWYYLAVADDGSVFFCHFNAVRVNFLIRVFSLDFELYLPGVDHHFFAHGFKADTVQWSTDRLFLQMGKNRLEGTPTRQEIHIEEVDHTLDLSFSAPMGAFREGSGRIYLDENKTEYMDMTFQPAMRFEGTIKSKGETRRIKGWAYSDHIAATFLTTELVKHINSVRIQAGDLFISGFEYLTVPKYLPHRVPTLIVTYKDRLLHWGSDFSLQPTSIYTDPETSLKVPQNFELSDRGDSFQLECTGNGSLLERIDALATVNKIVRKGLELAGIRSYGYVFREEVECRLNTPQASGTFQGDGIMESLFVK